MTQAGSKKSPKASRPHMPGYGMPKGTKGLLTWAWAEERLLASHNYYLTTVRPDGTPHVMPLWGIWVDERLYFSTGAKSVKLLKHGTLKSYPGLPHGMPTTHAELINADLLEFIGGRPAPKNGP